MVDTLGEAWMAGWRVTVRCAWGKRDGMKSIRECTYRKDLDVATLVWTRGKDMPLALLGERLKCPRCGSRRVMVMFHPPGNASRAVNRIV